MNLRRAIVIVVVVYRMVENDDAAIGRAVSLLLADEADVAGTKLIERIFKSSVGNETTLTECQFALTDGFTVTSGAAQSRLTV